MDELIETLSIQDDRRIFRVSEAIKRGVDPHKISEITKIDFWFISKIKEIIEFGNCLKEKPLDRELYLKAKEEGFLDSEISKITGINEKEFEKFNVEASFRIVDTCAAEFAAMTPYFYSAYNEECELEKIKERQKDKNKKKKGNIVVLGSGPIRIGQGIEFDYCSVHASWAIADNNYESIIWFNSADRRQLTLLQN